MIAVVLNNKKLNPISTELLTRGRKLDIYLAFITQFYFDVPKNVRLNSTHYFINKIPNKRELQQIAFNHSSDIDFRDLMNLPILFQLLMLLLHQMILYVLKRIF